MCGLLNIGLCLSLSVPEKTSPSWNKGLLMLKSVSVSGENNVRMERNCIVFEMFSLRNYDL